MSAATSSSDRTGGGQQHEHERAGPWRRGGQSSRDESLAASFPATSPSGWPTVPAGAAQPFGGRPEISRAVLATVTATVAAIVLRFLVHKWSLLIDVLLGVWTGSTAVSGCKVGTTARRADALFKIPQLPPPLPIVLSALACVPFAIGLLSLTITDVHRGSAADACSSLSAYETASADNSVSGDAWFARSRRSATPPPAAPASARAQSTPQARLCCCSPTATATPTSSWCRSARRTRRLALLWSFAAPISNPEKPEPT